MSVQLALEPLYRGYLRRLDEMVARVAGGAALVEVTARGGDGRLLVGPDGLPLRFDVADAASGETFEVCGARADAPAASDASVGRLGIRFEPGNWEALPIVCAFDGEPLSDDAEAIAGLVRGWAWLAAHGGFAGAAPERGSGGAGRFTGKLHSLSIELAGNEVRCLADLGTCPPLAVESLCRALAGFGDDRAPLAHATIGGSQSKAQSAR